MTINERFLKIIKVLYGGNKSAFANAIGVTPSVVENIVGKRQGKPSFDVLEKTSAIAEINITWLVTGHGEMFKPVTDEVETEEEVERKPRIPIDAAAGALSSLSEAVMEDDCEMRPVISNLPDYDFTIGVKGDSMQPEFQSGDEVACRFIDKSTFIQWGKPHVLDTNEGVVLKRIYNRKDSILCRSDNPAYEDFEIPKEDILCIALVVGSIRFY